MKNKANKWMFIIASLFIMNVAQAQDSTRHAKFTPEEKAERLTAHLNTELSLSDEQMSKIKTIYLEHIQKKETGETDKKQMLDELHKSISEILTPEQQKKFKELRDKRRELKDNKAHLKQYDQEKTQPQEQQK